MPSLFCITRSGSIINRNSGAVLFVNVVVVCADRCADETMLIPTRYKKLLPKEHSYPIGARDISDALENVPQLAELDLSFYAFQRSNHDQRGHFLVLTAEYRHDHIGLSAAKFMIEDGWYKPQWHLVVYAVPREIRHAVNKSLVSAGLGVSAKWLSEARTDTWLDSSHRLEFEFHSDSGELITLDAA